MDTKGYTWVLRGIRGYTWVLRSIYWYVGVYLGNKPLSAAGTDRRTMPKAERFSEK